MVHPRPGRANQPGCEQPAACGVPSPVLVARMRLRSLHLRQFRAHADTRLALAPGLTLLVGPNGAGKTNVLEAVGYLGLGKSLLGASDAHVMQRGTTFFSVEGEIEGERRAGTRVRVASIPGEGKRAFINGAPADRLAELVGVVPFVFISPADYELTAGGPADRRRMLDLTLSFAYPVYLDDLMAYRRALQQRNALLASVRRGGALPPGTLDAWDAELAARGARLVTRRRQFATALAVHLADAFERLDLAGDPPGLRYAPSVDTDEAGTELVAALRRTERRSRESVRTVVGPHLDEVVFTLGEHELRPYASQGQHRTFALALRLAQALFLAQHHDEPPVLLLDDVFGTLDAVRTARILAMLTEGSLGQSVVTAARADLFADHLSDTDAVFHVEHGAVVPSSLSPSLP